MTREDPLLIDHRGAVDWLTLNRPASGNALDPALVDALVDYFEGLRDRPATRVVVLRAEGRHFCAGLDLTDPGFNPPERGPNAIWAIQRRIDDAWKHREDWLRKSAINIAGMGRFSSDRSIRNYAERVWQAETME